jgi:hypothetical protein
LNFVTPLFGTLIRGFSFNELRYQCSYAYLTVNLKFGFGLSRPLMN